MRKKLLVGLLSAMMLFGITAQAFAEDGTFEIKEAEMKVVIPEEFVVFERIVDEFDPNLELINSSKEQLEKVFENGNIFLNAVMVPPDNEIVVTLTENAGSQEIFNFNYFKDKELETIASNLVANAQGNSGEVDYTGYETYKTDQASFIVLNLEQNSNAGQVYGKQYYTTVNGQAIYITLYSYVGEISAETEDMLKGIINSVTFEEIKDKPTEDITLMERLTEMITLKTLVIGGVVVVGAGIILIIFGLRKGKDEYEDDEEAYDEYEDGQDGYEDDAKEEAEDKKHGHQDNESFEKYKYTRGYEGDKSSEELVTKCDNDDYEGVIKAKGKKLEQREM